MLSLVRRLLSGGKNPAGLDNTPRRGRRAALSLEPLESRFVLASGFEIAYIGDLGADFKGPTKVYLAGGTNPIPAEAWGTYVPPKDYIKNTTRNVEFNSQEVISSPTSKNELVYITTSDDYTWLFVAQTVSANWPFDAADYDVDYASGYEAASLTTTPPAGVVKYSANAKNATVTWLAKDANGQPIERYFIRDAWGNKYIMQTSGVTDETAVRDNFLSAELPTGWRKFTGYLERDLTTRPAYDSAGLAQFNIFRTSADDAFQQITWNSSGKSIARRIPDMVIWGGPLADTILGRRNQSNLIHGGQKKDRIVALGKNDQIYGDQGFDTVVFRGRRSQYVVTALAADGSLIEVRTRRGGAAARVATLSNVEVLQFQDGVERTVHVGRSLSVSAIWNAVSSMPRASKRVHRSGSRP